MSRLSSRIYEQHSEMTLAVSMFVCELPSTRYCGTTKKSCMLCIDYYFKSCMHVFLERSVCLKKFPGAHNTVHWDIDSYDWAGHHDFPMFRNRND